MGSQVERAERITPSDRMVVEAVEAAASVVQGERVAYVDLILEARGPA
jgi:hypothetical protein